MVAPKARQLPIRDIREPAAIQQDVPARRTVQRGEQVEQRGLARARRTHDGDEFSPADGEVYVVQGGKRLCAHAGAVNLLDMLYFEQLHVFCLRFLA